MPTSHRRSKGRPGRRLWPTDRGSQVLVVLAACVAVAAVIYVALPGSGGGRVPGLTAQTMTTSAAIADDIFSSDPAAADSGFTTSLSDIAVSGATAVAVGSQTPAVLDGGAARGLFLVSRNGGKTWQLAGVSSPSGQGADLVAGGPAGWVALDQNYASANGTQVGAVWTSRDARSWTELDSAATTAPFNGATVDSVVTTGSGFVADGHTASGRALVWTSPDGSNWHRTQPPMSGTPAGIGSLAAHGNDVLIFTGTPASASFWGSSDGGLHWQQVSLPQLSALTAVSYAGVAAGPSGLYVYASADDQSLQATVSVILASPTGAAWSVVESKAPGGTAMNVLTAGAAGFAAGFQSGADENVYRSGDGHSWSAVGSIPGGATGERTIATAGTSILMAGMADGSGSDQPVPYLAAGDPAVTSVNLALIAGMTPAARAANAVAVGGGQMIVAGATNGSPAVWFPAGRVWQRAVVPAQPGALSAVTNGPSGWLAAGPGSSSTQLTVLTSVDGRQWGTPAGAAGVKGSSGGYSAVDPSGASSGPRGYVIGGTAFRSGNGSAFTAVAWFSPELSTWDGPVALPTRLVDTGISGVAGGNFGFVAIGFGTSPGTGKLVTAAWLSSDGRTWSAASPPLPSGATDASFGQVAATGNEIVVFGTARRSGTSFGFTDVSADAGLTWRESDLPDSAGVSAVTAATATAAGTAATYTAVGAGRQYVMLVSTRNLTSWTVRVAEGAGLSGSGRNVISGLAARGATLLGVGMTSGPVASSTTLWQVPLPS